MDNKRDISEERGLPLQHSITDSYDRNLAIVTGTSFAVALIALIAVVVWAGGDPSALVYVPLAAVTLALAVVAYVKVRVWAGWGNPQLFLPSSKPLHLGDKIVVRFRRAARRNADPAGLELSAWIEVDELTTVRGAPGRRQHVERVYEAPAEVVLRSGTGQTVEADLAIDVPLSEAPPSLALPANEVRWRLVVRIVAPHLPDDDSTFPLVVAPFVAQRLQSDGVVQ
ncbi:MAG: hypothetical protein ACC660_06890 [Acidimicrobiales bacterium]